MKKIDNQDKEIEFIEKQVQIIRILYKKEKLSKKTVSAFRKAIKEYYKKYKRDLPWRKNKNPYRVLVSEVMLQQTQVPRVIEKYRSFLKKFPDFDALAKAKSGVVIKEWQGLGYNRRGLFLKRAAKEVMKNYKGKLPKKVEELETLPGIGPATARSIAAFAYNRPETFIETNVRSVYIHFFFPNSKNVDDKKIEKLLAQTIDKKNPSDWYNALMDIGSLLKSRYGNPNKKSKVYYKQSRFEGSNRQLRGMILREITKNPASMQQLIQKIKHNKNENNKSTNNKENNSKKIEIKKNKSMSGLNQNMEEKIKLNLIQLEKEGFITKKKTKYQLR